MLKKQLQEDLKKSMLEKNTPAVSSIRMLLSAINYYEIQKGGAGYEASDEDVVTVLQKEVKQRRESIEQFKLGNRNDLVEKETGELAALEKYLPAQMSEEEIAKLVEDAISQTGAATQQDMGKVMGVLMPLTKGKADGSLVSKIVREKLGA